MPRIYEEFIARHAVFNNPKFKYPNALTVACQNSITDAGHFVRHVWDEVLWQESDTLWSPKLEVSGGGQVIGVCGGG